MELMAVLVGVLVGGAIGWLAAASRARAWRDAMVLGAETRAAAAVAELSAVRAELETRKREGEHLSVALREAEGERSAAAARLVEMQRRFEEQQRILDAAQQRLSDTFKSLASDILKASSESFLTLAGERFDSIQKQSASDLDARQKAIEGIVAPARDSLARLDLELRKIETERRGANEVLTDQLRSLSSQTNRLVDALKTPTVRGRWGEIQLRRVVEIAGMVEHCDFREQAEVTIEEARLRPDMTIRLPGGKSVAVDAKVPLQAYMEALDAETEAERAAKLRDHARQIRNHIDQLSSKSYWEALERTPEFVVLFLPGEMFFSAALQQDGTLIEDAAIRRVILATPTTLIALLKAVAYGWRQEQLAENAEHISEIGRQLHERLATMTESLGALGRSLRTSVECFNRAVGSLESRVLPAARRFRELGVAGKQAIRELEPVDSAPRELAPPVPANGNHEAVDGK